MPASASRTDSIEVPHHPGLQRMFWRMERVGWVVMASLLVLGLLGVFGQEGMLSNASAASADGSLSVEYRRFLHHQSPSDITLRIAPPGDGGIVELWMNSAYVHNIPVQHFHPRPVEERSASGRVLYRFLAEGAERDIVIFAEVNPAGIGNVPAHVGIVGGPSLSYTQFIYP